MNLPVPVLDEPRVIADAGNRSFKGGEARESISPKIAYVREAKSRGGQNNLSGGETPKVSGADSELTSAESAESKARSPSAQT